MLATAWRTQAAFWLSLELEQEGRAPRVWAAVLAGAALGLAWGVAARIWMRLIATHPEFTLGGTAFILAVGAQMGAFAGLAYAARRRGWRGWRHYVPRAVAVASILFMGVGPGVAMVAIVLAAALVVSRRGGRPPGWGGLLGPALA